MSVLKITIRKSGQGVLGRFQASDAFIDFLRRATCSPSDKPIVIKTKYGDCQIFARGSKNYEILGVWPNGIDVVEAARQLPYVEEQWFTNSELLLKSMQITYGLQEQTPAKASPAFLPTKIKGTLHLPVKPAESSKVDELANHLNAKFGHKQNPKKTSSGIGV